MDWARWRGTDSVRPELRQRSSGRRLGRRGGRLGLAGRQGAMVRRRRCEALLLAWSGAPAVPWRGGATGTGEVASWRPCSWG